MRAAAVLSLALALFSGRCLLSHPSVTMRRSSILALGGYRLGFDAAEDYDLWLRLALVSDVALLDEPLVQVRRHEANYTQNWEIAFTGRDHSLEKLQGTVDTGRRKLLRTERTRNALILAARHASLGNPVQMLRALYRALPYSWSSPLWWLGLVKTPLRPYVPQRLVDAYRRRS